MAFLGGLFDAFTGDSAKEAAAKNAALYQQYGTQGSNILGQYGTQAGKLYQDYLAQTQPLYQNLQTQGQQYLTSADERARQALAGGEQAFAPLGALGQKYGGATNLYLGALGVNGPQGVDAARAAFQTGPGYQFQQDEARKALEASAAARGGLLGGNTGAALTQRASDIANQEYGNYLNRLQGFVAPELTATTAYGTGIGGLKSNEATLLSQLGRAQTGLLGDVTSGQVGALGTATGGQAGILGNVAQGQVNVLGNVTGGQAAANTASAQAAQNASQNFWNGLFNVGKAVATGGLGGGGNLFGGGATSAVAGLGGSSGNLARPYYEANYGTPDRLFPNYPG